MRQAQQLGRYQLLDRIAYGGMAEIFRAKTFDQEGRAHLVAVKRVLHHLTTDEDFIKMLVDEAKLTAAIEHQNVARVFEFAHASGDYFIAMEYVDGKDVRALIERYRVKKQPIPFEIVAWIVMEVALALHAAHVQKDAQGRPLHIVHRDVSPSNMLCSYNGDVKLCDFGIAKATFSRVQTKTGVIKGKVKYMSPEQAMGRKLDNRSDLFSLGTVMYEMLTMEAPFQAASEVELIFAVRDAQKRDARTLNNAIPDELNAILEKVMSRSRSQRYQSGDELAQALRAFLDRHKPGWRRSSFGRFMRNEFADEIERELRLLEEFVLEGGDPSQLGENLIADALPADAPYTKFTAAVANTSPSVMTGTPFGTTASGASDAGPLPDLHAQPTRILNRADAPPRGVRAADTQAFTAPQPKLERTDEGLPPLSQLETRILSRPTAPPSKEPVGDLHAQPTKILNLPDRPPPTERGERSERKRGSAEPVATPSRAPVAGGAPTKGGGAEGPVSGAPKVVVETDNPAGEDTKTEVPLADEDLEEA